MKNPFLFTLVIAVTSSLLCSSFFWGSSEQNYEKSISETTAKTIKKISTETDLIPVGTGGGMMYGIRMKALSFYYYKEVDMMTARKLLVYCVEEYLAAINSNKKVRPYLVNYPFTEKNIEINIFFFKPDRRNLPSGKITIASAIEGKVEYQTDNPDGYKLDTLHEESYEESKKLISQEAAKAPTDKNSKNEQQ